MRRHMLLLPAVLVLAASLLAPARAQTGLAGGLLGDLNTDGQVTSVDALWVLWFVSGTVEFIVPPPNGDVNEDGTINAVDAQLILQYTAGLIGSLPPPP